eukprot:9939570-Ditylum_brightwellii.AAC.1
MDAKCTEKAYASLETSWSMGRAVFLILMSIGISASTIEARREKFKAYVKEWAEVCKIAEEHGIAPSFNRKLLESCQDFLCTMPEPTSGLPLI